jgi:tetratricopeptide (TPR) repeat protein
LLKRAVQLDPDFAAAHAWLAYGLARARRDRAALVPADRAIALNPDSPAALVALTFVYGLERRPMDELLTVKRVLAAYPQDLDAIGAAAEAYYQAGMLDRAIAMYSKALQADPSNLECRSQLARCYLYSGAYERGVGLLTQEQASGDIARWAMLLYKELGRWDKATEIANSGIRNFPDDHVNAYFAGCVFDAAGQPDKGRRIWLAGVQNAEALLATREDRGRRTFLGIMYAKLGMREKALEQAQRCLQGDRNDRGQLLFFLAKIRAILGDRAEAIAYLRQALSEGFLKLAFLDYHSRPHMGLHSLDRDPEFQGIRNEVSSRVQKLREQTDKASVIVKQNP